MDPGSQPPEDQPWVTQLEIPYESNMGLGIAPSFSDAMLATIFDGHERLSGKRNLNLVTCVRSSYSLDEIPLPIFPLVHRAITIIIIIPIISLVFNSSLYHSSAVIIVRRGPLRGTLPTMWYRALHAGPSSCPQL